MKKTNRRASFRPTNSEFNRYVLVDDETKPCHQRRYYTGDHTSRKTVWSRDQRRAMLYPFRIGPQDRQVYCLSQISRQLGYEGPLERRRIRGV